MRDVLLAVKALARSGQESVGKTISRLARQALGSAPHANARHEAKAQADTAVITGGFRPFTRHRGTAVVSNEDIDRLRDLEGV